MVLSFSFGGFGGSNGARDIISGSGSRLRRIGVWFRERVINNKVLRSRIASCAKYSMSWGTWGYSHMRQIGWFVVTSALITAVPLIFEYTREMQLEELERLQVAKGLAEGASPFALKEQGLASAIDPAVLR